MLVFWWTGKGFWTILLVFLVGVVVAAIQGALGGIGSGGPWFAVSRSGDRGKGPIGLWAVVSTPPAEHG
ncbi:MAG: hypothetical protein WDN44_08240 [Sphingomonas sp.]